MIHENEALSRETPENVAKRLQDQYPEFFVALAEAAGLVEVDPGTRGPRAYLKVTRATHVDWDYFDMIVSCVGNLIERDPALREM